MEEKFLYILNQNQKLIHKITRLYRDTFDDQQDLFQEIVYQLWKSFPSFRSESEMSTWIYRIALNTALSSYRKKRITFDHSENIPEKFLIENVSENSENEDRMFAALKELNDAEKAIISLFMEDYSYQEIASITGITENYVGVRINRIKEKLKIILGK